MLLKYLSVRPAEEAGVSARRDEQGGGRQRAGRIHVL